MAVTITKDYTVTKAKNDAKANVLDVIFNALSEHFESVAWVRTETGEKNGKNFIGVIANEIEVDGNTVPLVVGVEASAKDPVDRVTRTKTYEAFDFIAAQALYENKKIADAEKAAAKEAAKAKKIAQNKDVTEF